MSVNDFKYILNECKLNGYNHIGLTPRNGELLSGPEWVNILDILENDEEIISYHFFTNSIFLSDKFFNVFKKYKKCKLYISLNGSTSEEFMLLNNIKDSKGFDKSIKTILRNITLIKKVFLKTSKSNMITKMLYSTDKVYPVNYMNNWAGKINGTPLKDRKNFLVNGCSVLKEKNMISVDGDFLLCGCRDLEGETKIGNIFKTALDEILKSKEYYITPKICSRCTGAQ